MQLKIGYPFQCPPKLLPLQGVLLIAIIPRAMPWARSCWAFSPFLNHMRRFRNLAYAVDAPAEWCLGNAKSHKNGWKQQNTTN